MGYFDKCGTIMNCYMERCCIKILQRRLGFGKTWGWINNPLLPHKCSCWVSTGLAFKQFHWKHITLKFLCGLYGNSNGTTISYFFVFFCRWVACFHGCTEGCVCAWLCAARFPLTSESLAVIWNGHHGCSVFLSLSLSLGVVPSYRLSFPVEMNRRIAVSLSLSLFFNYFFAFCCLETDFGSVT